MAASSQPNPSGPWPPATWQPIQTEIEHAAAWWSGDETALIRIHQRPLPPSQQTRYRTPGRRRFWAKQATEQGKDRLRLHVPIAADIASTSADLLFGEPPAFVIPDAHQTNASSDAKTAQDRLFELADTDSWAARFLEAAEVASGLSGVYLRVAWDPTVATHPLLTVVHADHAVPEFRWGHLTAVTFWSTIAISGGTWWRHLERYEPGLIRHTLHEGTKDRLGPARPLNAQPATATLATQPDGTVPIPDQLRTEMLVRYIPNMRPNRAHRHVPVGRADGAGTWALMDALDEVYSSWMRDVRLAKARIIVPDQYLDRRGPGKGAGFDSDREVFTPLDIDPGAADKGITLAQFEIRAADHAATASALVERIISTASYAPATFGLDAAGTATETATGVRAREAKSLRTTNRKQAYWAAAADLLRVALIVDATVFGTPVTPFRTRIQFADGLPDDPQSTAQTIMLLTQAEAVSIETRVRMAQPDLDEAEVATEVARIKDEQGTTVTDPTGGFPTGPDNGESP